MNHDVLHSQMILPTKPTTFTAWWLYQILTDVQNYLTDTFSSVFPMAGVIRDSTAP